MLAQGLSRVRLFVTPWTVARQVPRSMEFFRQEHMSEWPFPSPWDLPDQRLNPGLLNGNLNLSLIVTAVFRQETSKKIAAHHRSGLCRGHPPVSGYLLLCSRQPSLQ